MSYTIVEVGESKPWTGKFGEMVDYQVRIDGDAHPLEVTRKATSPPPSAGDTIDGEIKPAGPSGLRKLKAFPPGGAVGGSNATGRSYGKSDTERAEMRRMSAQKQALELLKMELESGLLPKDSLAGVKASELLKPRIDWFHDDILGSEMAK